MVQRSKLKIKIKQLIGNTFVIIGSSGPIGTAKLLEKKKKKITFVKMFN